MGDNIGYNREMERSFRERVQQKNQQNVANHNNNQEKGIKDELEGKSKTYCNLMVALCLVFASAFVFMAIDESCGYDSSKLLIWCYSISAIICVVSCMWFRLLRCICKAILILLNNDSERRNSESNQGQQS